MIMGSRETAVIIAAAGKGTRMGGPVPKQYMTIGGEPVLLFSSDLTASITPEARRLRNFTKVELQPGETRTVVFELKAEDLAFVNHDLEWTLEPGEFRLAVGTQAVMVNCVE